jgi:hypothetical protein
MALFRAVSLRKLTGYNSSYTGACIRVQRSSDNTQQDIGFVSGALDVSSLATFVGSGTGYVVRWYDQSGTANDWFADGGSTTVANFPVIVQSGTLVTVNGKPAVRATTGQNFTSSGIGVQNLSVLAVWSVDDVTLCPGGQGVGLISGGASYSGAYWLGTNGQGNRTGQQMLAIRGFEATLHGTINGSNGQNIAGGFQGTTGFAYSMYKNGSLDTSGTGGTTMSNNGAAMLFATAGAGSGLTWTAGTCQEIIEWNTANGDTTNEANSLDQYNAWVAVSAVTTNKTVSVNATASVVISATKNTAPVSHPQSVAVTATTSTTVSPSKLTGVHNYPQSVAVGAVTSTAVVANKVPTAAQWSTTALQGSSMVFFFGNLQAAWNGTDGNVQSVTSHATTRWYAEVSWNALGSSGGDVSVDNGADTRYCHVDNTGLVRRRRDGTIIADDLNTALSYTAGHTVCIACDAGNQMVYYRIDNGPWNGNRSADPVTGLGGYPVPIDAGEALFIKAAMRTGDQVTINTGVLGFTYPMPQGYTGWSNTLFTKSLAINCSASTVVARAWTKLLTVLTTCTSSTSAKAGLAKFVTVLASCVSSTSMRKAVAKTVSVTCSQVTTAQAILNHISVAYNVTVSAFVRAVAALLKQTTYKPSTTPTQSPSSFYTEGNNLTRGPSTTVDNTTAAPASKPTLSSFYQGGSHYS